MIVLDYRGISKCYFCSDIHGEFRTFFWRIKQELSKGREIYNEANPFEVKEEKSFEEMARDILGRGTLRLHDPFEMVTDAPIYDDSALSIVESDTPIRRKKATKEQRFDNSLIFVCGDSELDFYDGTRREELFNMFNEMLAQNNTTILFIRGNKDNPLVFSEQYINLSNIKTIPDYSVVLTREHNILCVGGGISLDRLWAQEQEKHLKQFGTTTKTMYWKDEAPIWDAEKLQEIIDSNIEIHGVCSHVAPLCVNCENDKDVKHWIETDPTLEGDINKERQSMQDIYEFLTRNKQPLIWWVFGHYHKEFIHKDKKKVIFCGLGVNHKPKDLMNCMSSGTKIKMPKLDWSLPRRYEVANAGF